MPEETAEIKPKAESKEGPPMEMVVPTIHTELMTPEQRNLFALKERARILINLGRMTIDEAFQRNLISQADAAAMHMLSPMQMHEPQPVLASPENPPIRGSKCC